MATTMNGELSDDGALSALTKLFKDQTVYLGFATATIDDTDDLSTITESVLDRINITSLLGTPALDSGVPKLKNSSAINSANAAGTEALTSWFITTVESAAIGDIIAYANTTGDALSTNAGEPVTFDIDALVISLD